MACLWNCLQLRLPAQMAEPDAFLQLVYEDKRIQRDLSASDPNMGGRLSTMDPRCAMRAPASRQGCFRGRAARREVQEASEPWMRTLTRDSV